jgi:hypothetical protein
MSTLNEKVLRLLHRSGFYLVMKQILHSVVPTNLKSEHMDVVGPKEM